MVGSQQANMVPLSVCIPTHNDADTIERALDSINEIADEIVNLDSRSSDGTREIVSRYNQSTIHNYEFQGFADMFETAAKKASNEWVLFVDADEEVRSELRQEIQSILHSPKKDAYKATKRNKMWGKWMHSEHKPRPILSRKRALCWDNAIVGEEWGIRDKYELGELEHPIHHYAYENIDEYIEKWNRYTSAEALDEIKKGRNPSIPRYYSKGIGAIGYRYLYEKSILDGWQGLVFAVMSGIYFFIVDAKMRDLSKLREKRADWEKLWIEEKI